MNQELLNQAISLFDKYEKWNAFIELSNAREEMKRKYFGILKSRIYELSIDNQTYKWNILLHGNNDAFRWYINEFGHDSICLNWDWVAFRLWCQPNHFNSAKAKELLIDPHFIPIKKCFDSDKIFSISNPNVHHFFEEKHRYYFSDGLSYLAPEMENHERLSWFAGNKSEELAKMIMEKVNRFRTPEITELLIELNRECKFH